jgi:hypothetical protein
MEKISANTSHVFINLHGGREWGFVAAFQISAGSGETLFFS